MSDEPPNGEDEYLLFLSQYDELINIPLGIPLNYKPHEYANDNFIY